MMIFYDKKTINMKIANFTINYVLDLPRIIKRFTVISLDIILCVFTTWFSYYLRLGHFIKLTDDFRHAILVSLISIVIAIPIFIKFGLYRHIFRYSGMSALIITSKSIALYGLFFSLILMYVGIENVPRTIGIIQPLLMLLAIGGSRAFARFFLTDLYLARIIGSKLTKILIYGAGESGRQLMEAIGSSRDMQMVGFVDDDPKLSGQNLNGMNIYNTKNIAELIKQLNVNTVFIALPRSAKLKKIEIIEELFKLKVVVRIVPNFTDILHGKLQISDLRNIEIEDLLERDLVPPDFDLMRQTTKDQVIIISGAGGSIGSEICRQICQLEPRTIILIEHSEFALYKIFEELKSKFTKNSIKIVPLLASVRDRQRMNSIFSIWRPHVVYHAAAYKHVPLVEQNLLEGIRNNVFGTIILAELSITFGVERFVLISTDKAVRPTNIMGASKRLAEMCLQALSENSERTIFTMVRFGNVLGSSGSVVPIFRQQINEGGPITLTHPDVTRYFMTIPEASELVIQACSMACGGEVFVLDMGQPVKIYDLAKRIIELSGHELRDIDNPDGDIEIKVTGLRPGEKLYEELLIGNDSSRTTHERILMAHEEFLSWSILEDKLHDLNSVMDLNDLPRVYSTLENIVHGFRPSDIIVDSIYRADDFFSIS